MNQLEGASRFDDPTITNPRYYSKGTIVIHTFSPKLLVGRVATSAASAADTYNNNAVHATSTIIDGITSQRYLFAEVSLG